MIYIGNFIIIFMLYILPVIVFLKTFTIKKNSKLIKAIVTISYVIIYLSLPELYTNILPFILIIFILINWSKSQGRYEEYKKYKFSIKDFKISEGIIYALIAYGLVIVAATISYYLFSVFNIPMEKQEVVTMLSGYDLVSFVITIPFTVIFAPVVEEFTFRYILFSKCCRDSINKKVPFFISAFIVSVLFAGVHFSITAFAMLFTISFYNCYLVEKKGFWYAVFVHIVVNGVTMAALLASKLA